MQTGLSIVDLAKKIEAQAKAKKDYITDTANVHMEVHKDGAVLALRDIGEAFPILPAAHDQIGARVGIPAKYYDRMLADAPTLLAANVNHWFRDQPEKRMVRTLDGNARAFLSNRYQRIDNDEIAKVALPVLYDIPEVQIVSSEITPHRLYIQAVTPRITREVKRGDVVQAGVIISNSEIGSGAVNVSPLVYRLVCLNGMIRPDGKFRAYHVGRQIEDNAELWKDDTRQADDRAVLLKVRDMIASAVDAIRFDEYVDKLSGLTDARVTGDPAKTVELVAAKIGATQDERGDILRALIEGGDLSAWGIVNAVTAQANVDKRSYDRAVEFEAAGGALVDLAPTEWKRVLEAA